MSNIPSDIYEHIHELSLAIVNATETGDDALADSLCQTLRAYYDEQASLGRFHPFLTEAMADLTNEAVEAARLYELALEQASAFPDEPTHTKKISLAGQLISLGQCARAGEYLRDGRLEAVRLGDTFWIRDADRLLHDLAT